MNNRQRLEYLRNEKKSFKNLRYISVSVRDSSNSLATIIAGHLLKMATEAKKDTYFNDNYSDIFANCLLKVWLDKNETVLMGFHDVERLFGNVRSDENFVLIFGIPRVVF